MLEWTKKGLAAAGIAFMLGGCAIVPMDRQFDNGHAASVTIAPAIVLPPLLFWGHGSWHHGHRGHGWRGRGWRGHHGRY